VIDPKKHFAELSRVRCELIKLSSVVFWRFDFG
jgi:hypothetical protein